MEELAVDSDLDRGKVAKVPLEHLLVVLDCAILICIVAKRTTNLRHVLIDILFALGIV